MNDGDALLLRVLDAVNRDSQVTQRRLSTELDIALGLANAYLKRCVRKGLVKVTHAPLNRYAYYLTPQGFAEKSRLTVEYLKLSFDFFRNARRQCREIFLSCLAEGHRHLALVGSSELAEAAVLSAAECGVSVVAVIDAGSQAQRCAGVPVVRSLAEALALGPDGAVDALVVTDLQSPQATFDRMLWAAAEIGLAPARVHCPPLLNVNREPPALAAERKEPAR